VRTYAIIEAIGNQSNGNRQNGSEKISCQVCKEPLDKIKTEKKNGV
jgi:hypothetical protein